MSAFLCSNKHFQIIAQYIGKLNSFSDNETQELADKLKRINNESVNYRYREKTRFTKVKFESKYSPEDYSSEDIIMLIKCWRYQSNEKPENLEYKIMIKFILYFMEDHIGESNSSKSSIWSI